jgi:hypothetical protein
MTSESSTHERAWNEIPQATLEGVVDLLNALYPQRMPSVEEVSTEAGRLAYAKLVGVRELVEHMAYAARKPQ